MVLLWQRWALKAHKRGFTGAAESFPPSTAAESIPGAAGPSYPWGLLRDCLSPAFYWFTLRVNTRFQKLKCVDGSARGNLFGAINGHNRLESAIWILFKEKYFPSFFLSDVTANRSTPQKQRGRVWEQKPAYLGPARPLPGVSAGLLKDFGLMPESPNAVSSTQADLDHPKIILDVKIVHSVQLWDAFSVKTFVHKKNKKDLRKPSGLGVSGTLSHGPALSSSLWWGSERRG